MKKGEKIVNAAEGLRLGKWLIFFLTLESGPWRRRVVCVAAARWGGGFDGCSRSLRVETSRVEISRRKSASSEEKGRNQETLRD